jgi:hypothetical protein
MKIPNKMNEKDQAVLDKFDALLGSVESSYDVTSELQQFGLNAEDLRSAAFQRIRERATQRYSSRGKDIPPKMGEALAQLKPPTAAEEHALKEKRAVQHVQNFLAAVRTAGASAFQPLSLAPAFRNKEDETPESDRQLLDEQQKQLDDEGEQ